MKTVELLYLLGACAACFLPMTSRAASDRTDGLFISHVHRGGGASERPDNTLETFLWCWGNGSAVECDPRFTKDGVAVMFHDHDLSRTPRGVPEARRKDKIADLNWTDIRDLDVGSYLSPDYASERIPTLDAVFAAMKGHPTYLAFVDDKGIPPAYIMNLAKSYGVFDQIYYTTPHYGKILDWIKEDANGKSLLWIGAWPRNRSAAERARVRAHFEKILEPIRKNGFKGVSAVSLHVYWDPTDPVDEFVLGTPYLKSLIDEFHRNGVKVAAIPFAGGKEEKVYHRLWELGCDGFSTDYPSVMFKVIKDLKAAAKR